MIFSTVVPRIMQTDIHVHMYQFSQMQIMMNTKTKMYIIRKLWMNFRFQIVILLLQLKK